MESTVDGLIRRCEDTSKQTAATVTELQGMWDRWHTPARGPQVAARDLPLGRTFAQPDSVVKEWHGCRKGWQETGERGGFKLAYQEREHAEGKSLCLVGEIHVVDGQQVLVKYDGQTIEEVEDWWPEREEGWYMPEMSDTDVEAYRAKLRREKFLKENADVRDMMRLVQRVKRGSKLAVRELHSVLVEQPDRVEWFRDAVREYGLGDAYLVYTVPRKVRRLMKDVTL